MLGLLNFDASMHCWRFLFVLSPVFTLIACGQPRDVAQHNVSHGTSQSAVSILYLSDVVCSNNSWCDKTALEKLQQSCIEKGFTQKRPSGGIVSSRSIKEGISATYVEISKFEKKTKVETVTPSGIVMIKDGPIRIKTVFNDKMVQGYCIGSEYLVGQ